MPQAPAETMHMQEFVRTFCNSGIASKTSQQTHPGECNLHQSTYILRQQKVLGFIGNASARAGFGAMGSILAILAIARHDLFREI